MCLVCSKPILNAFMDEYCSKQCYFKTLKVPVRDIWERDGKTCHICGESVCLDEASRDHLVPRSHGGPTTFDNVALAQDRKSVV